MSEANFTRLFPDEEGSRFFLLEASAGQRRRRDDGGRGSDERLRRGCAIDGRAHRGVPPRREHVPVHVPDARRPRPAARHRGLLGGALAKRPRAAARAGPSDAPSATATVSCSRSSCPKACCCSAWVCRWVWSAPSWPSRRPPLDRGGALPTGASTWLLLGPSSPRARPPRSSRPGPLFAHTCSTRYAPSRGPAPGSRASGASGSRLRGPRAECEAESLPPEAPEAMSPKTGAHRCRLGLLCTYSSP